MSGYSGGGSSGVIPPYASGSYFMPEGMERINAGGAATAGTIRLVPFILRRSVSITDLLVRITTLSASGNFQLSIYASDPATNNPTGAPLYTSASQSTASTGLVDIASVGWSPSAGLYWAAVQADTNGASVVFVAPDISTTFLQKMVGVNATASLVATINYVALTKSGTYGTWPTLTGNLTTDSLSFSSSSSAAAIAFKVA